MSTIVLLFAVGLILLGFEVFVPGAILGIFGGLALLAGVVLAYLDFGADGGLIAFGVAASLVGALLYIEFRLLPRTTLGRRLFLQAAVTGRSEAVAAAPDIVGRLGQAVTTLAPSGYVMIEGRRYEAYSQSGYVTANTPIKVIGRDNFRLIVTLA
ncbi:MAG TPA: NfeD family protein [Candidatus Synoicihabitans sp.]|nr:NfeD family protein [Candidatus Synoicihabitans sp.]